MSMLGVVPVDSLKEKKTIKINTVRKVVLCLVLFQAVGILQMEGKPSEVGLALLLGA